MRRFLIFVFLLVAVLVSGSVYVFYNYSGVKLHLKVQKLIANSPNLDKEAIEKDYVGDGLTGIYSSYWDVGFVQGLWLWTSRGLKFFKTDKNTILFYLDGCTQILSSKTDQEIKKVSMEEGRFPVRAKWLSKLKQGDFIVLYMPESSNGIVSEAHAYNWWYFLHKDMKSQCEK